jgi:hypothetical protein
VIALVPATGFADDKNDGYCDYIEGTADATAATLMTPQLFGQFGYIEQPSFAVAPSGTSENLRAIGGVRYSLTNIYAGKVTKTRAGADCRRHDALSVLRGATAARALAARVQVLDAAQAEADKILNDSQAALEGRRTTAQEATATRLRVEELRTLTADAHRELASLPPPDQRPLGSLLMAYRIADDDMESSEGTLRTLNAYDLNIRFGADKFLQGPNQSTNFFGVVELGVNIGALWVGSANSRAAAGRKRYVRSGHDPLGLDSTIDQIRATLELETKRIAQTQALVADLDAQLQALAEIQSDESRRFRETVWFDAIKAKADLAYLQAHVAALQEVIGGDTR